MTHNLEKCVFHEKNHISSPLYPIDLKFVVVVDIMNIYHQKNFQKFWCQTRLARRRQKSHENAAKFGTVGMISYYLKNQIILH